MMDSIKQTFKNPKFQLFGGLFAFAVLILILSISLSSNQRTMVTTSTKASEFSKDISLSLSPSNISVLQGEQFVITIRAQALTDSYTIQGYRFGLLFDNKNMQLLDITYKLGKPSVGLAQTAQDIKAINKEGSIAIQGEDQSLSGIDIDDTDDPVEVVTLTFVALTDDTPTLEENPAEHNKFYTVEDDGEIRSVSAGISTEPTFSITARPSSMEEMEIPLKLTLQGIQEEAPEGLQDFTALVTAAAIDNMKDKYSTLVDMKINEAAEWEGTATIPIDSRKEYVFYIKSPIHAARKVCSLTPLEDEPGAYECEKGEGIQINEDTELDFSSILLFTGDLPEQDGVIDSKDVTSARNNIGRTDAEALYNADSNLDGIVDTQDHGLVITALEQYKGFEEELEEEDGDEEATDSARMDDDDNDSSSPSQGVSPTGGSGGGSLGPSSISGTPQPTTSTGGSRSVSPTKSLSPTQAAGTSSTPSVSGTPSPSGSISPTGGSFGEDEGEFGGTEIDEPGTGGAEDGFGSEDPLNEEGPTDEELEEYGGIDRF